jgi:stage III sporulation protein SpoIIIAA
MGRLDEFVKTKGLLTQALSLSFNSLPNSKSVQEARMHMKKALSELDNASKAEIKKKATTDDQIQKLVEECGVWHRCNGSSACEC